MLKSKCDSTREKFISSDIMKLHFQTSPNISNVSQNKNRSINWSSSSSFALIFSRVTKLNNFLHDKRFKGKKRRKQMKTKKSESNANQVNESIAEPNKTSEGYKKDLKGDLFQSE